MTVIKKLYGWIALSKTVGLCLISITIEAVSAGKAGKKWFEELKQPEYSFPFSFWYLVGALYYIICGIIAYREFHQTSAVFTLPIVLLALIMVVNGLTNFVLFRYRSLSWFLQNPLSVLGSFHLADGVPVGVGSLVVRVDRYIPHLAAV